MQRESQIINKLQSLFSTRPACIGIGDDAAVLENGLMVSTDACVEGVHFLRGEASWAEVAYKLFASNGSDMAAMGGKAESYFLSLGIPFDWTDTDLENFIEGIRTFLSDYPANLLGGDIVRCPVFFGAVTVMGRAFNQPWLRSGAKKGDYIYVTGTLGDSRLYLNKVLDNNVLPFTDNSYFRDRHYKPSPRSSWAEIIAKQLKVHAAMDISDGLVEDLRKLCSLSQCFFNIDASLLPISEEQIGLDLIKTQKKSYLREALIGGEDYELIIISPDDITSQEALQMGIKLTNIGNICGDGENSILFNGSLLPSSQFKGYSHS